jgi:ABC-type uncharacterized transport system fused permease/ATPase subunit
MHAPVRAFRFTHKAVPWMTELIQKLQKSRNYIYRIYKKNNSIDNFERYKCYRNKVKKIIRNAKKKF